MFEDLRKAIGEVRQRMRNHKAFMLAHKDEFDRVTEPLDKARWWASGIFALVSFGFIALSFYYASTLMFGAFIALALWFYRMWQVNREETEAIKRIFRRHNRECPYCGQPMQERTSDNWTLPKDYGYIIGGESSKSDYDFTHLPQDQNKKE